MEKDTQPLNLPQYGAKAQTERYITKINQVNYMYFLYLHCIFSCLNLIVSSFHSLVHLQNTLTNEIVYNGLSPADQLTLGVVRIWGAGNQTISTVSLIDKAGLTHKLTPQHNLSNQVRKVAVTLH